MIYEANETNEPGKPIDPAETIETREFNARDSNLNVEGIRTAIYRNYKARVFEMLFSQPEYALQLYNGINGTSYSDPDLLKINTLSNAIYMGIHNDVSFVIDYMMPLFEHQSTYSPNLSIRFLLYVADEYSEIIRDAYLYGKTAVRIPAPQFIIFYNGREEQPEVQELRLSDLYFTREEDPKLELKAVMLNINKGFNGRLMDKCQVLKDYTEFVAKVREYAGSCEREKAIQRAIDDCIAEGILAGFLRKNKSEVYKMCLYEYDAERHRQQERAAVREEVREEVKEEVKAEVKAETLSEAMAKDKETLIRILRFSGEVPSPLEKKIISTDDSDLLHSWILTAACADNPADFEAKMKKA